MEKITTKELSEMIKLKFLEKGLSQDEVTEEILKDVTSKIKEEVNMTMKKSQPQQMVNVDISKNEIPTATPGIEPSSITSSTTVNKDVEEVYKKEGELEERERLLKEKEIELINREQDLRTKEDEYSFKPEMPEELNDKGSEKIFIFDENQLSMGSEKMSNYEFNLVDSPEEKMTMKEIWLKEGRKEAEVYKVNFEKIGTITFNPFEGTSSVERYIENDSYKNLKPEDFEAKTQTNMVDVINPVKDVIQPMTDDMGLNTSGNKNIVGNISEDEFDEILQSKLKEIIQQYIK